MESEEPGEARERERGRGELGREGSYREASRTAYREASRTAYRACYIEGQQIALI